MVLRILITGGCGAIGSEVVNRLKRNPDYFIINLDKLTYAGNPAHIEAPYDNYKFIQGDICESSLITYVLASEKPNVIMHFAAETHVDNSFGNSFAFTQSNVFGTHVLLECVRKHMSSVSDHGCRLRLFLHMSTDEVYGSVADDEPAKNEQSLFAPSNPYSATKAAAEMICHAYLKSFNIPIIIARCNNAVSKYQHEEKLIPRSITNLLENKKIPIHGEGLSKRTFIHAYDIADAFELIMNKGTIGNIYNIGTEMEFTVKDVASAVLALIKPGEDVEDWVEYQQDRPFQDYRYSVDTTELRKLGWEPKFTFEDCIQYVLERIVSGSV